MTQTPLPLSLDSLLPAEVAAKAEDVGVKKGHMDFFSMFMLGILAGVFIGLGAVFCTTVVTGISDKVGFGLTKLIGGVVFCLGLVLVVVAGAELFTGNNLLVMAAASRKLPVRSLLWSWVVVYAGNFVGSILTAYMVFLAEHHTGAEGAVGVTALRIAEAKCSLDFLPALARGILCNALVCLAVWLTFSCRTTGHKIVAILFPITAFVAAGFEHCVANMYFIPVALFVKTGAAPGFWQAAGVHVGDFAQTTWGNMLTRNLLPVTIGNVLGGGVFVGVIYWMIYLRPPHRRH